MAVILNATEKVQLLQRYRDDYALPVLVETGLWCGHGSGMEVTGLDDYYAIDVQKENTDAALAAGHAAVCGDSRVILPGLLNALERPALFWLDAHGIDGDPDGWPPCPVLDELAAISDHRDALELEHVVLIDDLRQFPGAIDPAATFRDAPTVAELRGYAIERSWKVLEAYDVMRLTP